MNNLGSTWNDLGDHNKAMLNYEQALAIDRAVYGEKYPAEARDLNNLCAAYFELGK